MNGSHINANSTNGTFRKRKKILIGCFFLISLLCILLIFSIVQFTFQIVSGPVSITDIRIATDLESEHGYQLSKVKASEPKIFCIVRLSTPNAVMLRIKWYLDEQLLYEDQALVRTWHAFYIEPLSGGNFPIGNYKIEVLILNNIVRTIYFEIEP